MKQGIRREQGQVSHTTIDIAIVLTRKMRNAVLLQAKNLLHRGTKDKVKQGISKTYNRVKRTTRDKVPPGISKRYSR